MVVDDEKLIVKGLRFSLEQDGMEVDRPFLEAYGKHIPVLFYGFQIDSDRISLLSIVIYDPYSDVTFVGHTGILIKDRDDYLFVEKIAFEQPYQATKVKTVDELLNILSLRPEYFGEEGEAGPFVYNNGEYIGTLKAKA